VRQRDRGDGERIREKERNKERYKSVIRVLRIYRGKRKRERDLKGEIYEINTEVLCGWNGGC